MLGRSLKAIREFHGISINKLAGEINISKSYISEIENGKKKPSLEIIKSYSDYFEIPISSIFFFEEAGQADNNYKGSLKRFVSEKILRLMETLKKSEFNNGR